MNLFSETRAGIPQLTECTTVMVFGPVASGKTHLMKTWLETMPRSLVLDTVCEYDDETFENIWASPKQLVERLKDDPDNYHISYHPRDVIEGFNWCYETIWQLDKTRWFLVEECHEVTNEKNMINLVKYARKRQLGAIGASQRIADVDKNLITNARMIVLFHTFEARDRDAIRDRFGREVEQAVLDLRPCIYDDATKVCTQVPEMLVYQRGKSIQIYDPLGKSSTGPRKESESIEDVESPNQTEDEREDLNGEIER